MSTITIRSPEVSSNIKSFLSQEYLSGSTLNVDSSVNFSNGAYIIVGEPGLENTEITSLTASPPTNTSITVNTLKFSHPRGTPVYYVPWDKYSLEYRVTSGDVWVAYAGMPVSISYDAMYTEYRDSAATSAYNWRYRYYSTEKSAYSDYSDTILASGWPRGSVGYMVREVRKIINDPDSQTVSDAEIIRYFNTAQDKIYALFDRWWFLLTTGTAISTVSGQKNYSLPTDFGRMHSVKFNYVSNDTDISYNLKYLPLVEYDYEARDNNADNSDEIKYWTLYPGDELNVWPKPDTAGLDIIPLYYKRITDLDSFADVTEVPLSAMLVDYALGEINKIRKEEGKADYYDKLFKQQIELLKLMQRKQVGQPRQLWTYKGRYAEDRFFGARNVNDDKENYW